MVHMTIKVENWSNNIILVKFSSHIDENIKFFLKMFKILSLVFQRHTKSIYFKKISILNFTSMDFFLTY